MLLVIVNHFEYLLKWKISSHLIPITVLDMVIIPILQKRKTKVQEDSEFSWGHTASGRIHNVKQPGISENSL